MKIGEFFAAFREKLRKLDLAIAEAEALVERKLYEKHTGRVAPPVTRGDVRATQPDRRRGTNQPRRY